VLANCDKNADLAVRAVNAYKKRGGADIRQLQDRITKWADDNFPNRTTADILLKLYEEVGEYARNPRASLEMGDIMILLLDVAHQNGIDVHKAVEEKMDINEKRDWTVDPNTRIMRHVNPS
jgi:NTP pyrophosphatase (non-canonical NTP hydrolase)